MSETLNITERYPVLIAGWVTILNSLANNIFSESQMKKAESGAREWILQTYNEPIGKRVLRISTYFDGKGDLHGVDCMGLRDGADGDEVLPELMEIGGREVAQNTKDYRILTIIKNWNPEGEVEKKLIWCFLHS